MQQERQVSDFFQSLSITGGITKIEKHDGEFMELTEEELRQIAYPNHLIHIVHPAVRNAETGLASPQTLISVQLPIGGYSEGETCYTFSADTEEGFTVEYLGYIIAWLLKENSEDELDIGCNLFENLIVVQDEYEQSQFDLQDQLFTIQFRL